MKVRSLFISDCHFGSEYCNHEKLAKFLSEVECEYLYIVGDFIDGWLLKSSFKWHNNYNLIIQKILRLSRKGTKVYYLYGNHDDFLEQYDGLHLGDNIIICRETSFTTLKEKNYLIIHGDQFDGVITKFKYVQYIGALIYEISLGLNKLFRVFKFSFSNFLKQKAKEAVKYINNYEVLVSDYCKQYEFDGVITGHIHKPADKTLNGIHYLNCGDWIESNTAIIETLEGELKLIKL
jgi:UDP-2,3-diacylglucosamine pyrophosphatase LpxH